MILIREFARARNFFVFQVAYQEQFLGHLEFQRLGICFQSKNRQHRIRIGMVVVGSPFLACRMVLELEHTLVVEEHMELVCMVVEVGLLFFQF